MGNGVATLGGSRRHTEEVVAVSRDSELGIVDLRDDASSPTARWCPVIRNGSRWSFEDADERGERA
jgi:hypothetical protein